MQRRVIILGAAGRDFHNFNVYFRDNENYKVVAFTATQIPELTTRNIPPNWLENSIPTELTSILKLTFTN